MANQFKRHKFKVARNISPLKISFEKYESFGLAFGILYYVICLILKQINSHIFNFAHRILRKTNNLKTEELHKNIFASLFSVHNTIRLHVTSILVHDVINLLYTEELPFEINMKLCSMRLCASLP